MAKVGTENFFNMQELGFPGVEIGSHINEWNLDAPELEPVFAVSKNVV